MALRVLITGSRRWCDSIAIRQALQRILEDFQVPPSDVVVVHGAARGADSVANGVAGHMGMKVEPHPADWETHGKKAGHLRNAEMIKLGADVCYGFPLEVSPGTWNCLRQAVKAGIPTYVCTVVPINERGVSAKERRKNYIYDVLPPTPEVGS